MEELKGYFQDTNDDEMIKELHKTNTSMMRDLTHLNIVQLTRIPTIATINWIWTDNLTKLTPQNLKLFESTPILSRLIIANLLFMIEKCGGNEGPRLLINGIHKMM